MTLNVHRECRGVHYLWPGGHPVEELLHERHMLPAEAVAPDRGRTDDVCYQLVVDENAQSQNDLEPRTKRAVVEAMDVLAPLERWLLRGTSHVRQQVRNQRRSTSRWSSWKAGTSRHCHH
jgi:hypothetical protein